MTGPISSAVVLPDPDPETTKSPRTKRRQSFEFDESSKRPRFSESSEASPSALQASPKLKLEDETPGEKPANPAPDRRKSSLQEEKKRGQRLFGGLLSTLSQSAPNGPQKRRHEIEKRQQEKAKLQKAEDESRRARKREDLAVTRKAEQIKFDEASMRTRHTNVLAMAHSLKTKTEPKLYYKPWELLPREEEIIRQQIKDAEALVRREEEEFAERHPDRPKKKSSIIEKANVTSTETVGKPQSKSPSVSKTFDTHDTPVHITQEPDAKQSLEEQNGEVVVENDEDTVIY
ncbi:pinin/SDK/memA/ protein conserved region-domain-containing protein [Amylocarpus encephaloides]|uniref:Pinin/SDK/memA/ protein conserved region-domain-containing protein n=1 Tax=Amylocarpus encephaloides TaxID=45428 RepID=A0A9P7YP95_9HELO|nr:pinin/SDK/memA/ protein conserved region-domain-containing protein [Amylocarpus encephaloides]